MAAKRSIEQLVRLSLVERGTSASPRNLQFAQLQFGPHLQDGPHLQTLGLMAHLQIGVQVQGLHLQILVIGRTPLFGLWSSRATREIECMIERSG